MGNTLNVSVWSTAADDNDGIDAGIGSVRDLSAPTDVDNWTRALMASIKRYLLDTDGALTSGGTANALTLTTNRSISAGQQARGFAVRFKAANSNTGAATLAVDGLPAVAIKRANGTDLQAGDITAGSIYDAVFDGTNYQLIGAGTFVRYASAATQTISRDAAGAVLELRANDDGATGGPYLSTFRHSASPAANDALGGMSIQGRDSAGNGQVYAAITGRIISPAEGAENGEINFSAVNAGTVTTVLGLSGSALYPLANNAYDLGAGSLRFGSVFANALEIGNPSDTTLTRSSAGVVAVEGVPLLRANQNLGDVANAVAAFGTLASALPGLPTATPNSGDLVPMYAAGSTGVWRADSSTNVLERMLRGKFGIAKGTIIWNNGANWVALAPPGGTSTHFLAIDSAKNVLWALSPF